MTYNVFGGTLSLTQSINQFHGLVTVRCSLDSAYYLCSSQFMRLSVCVLTCRETADQRSI